MTLLYNVVASDSNGDSITISAPVIPDWMTFTDNGNGTRGHFYRNCIGK